MRVLRTCGLPNGAVKVQLSLQALRRALCCEDAGAGRARSSLKFAAGPGPGWRRGTLSASCTVKNLLQAHDFRNALQWRQSEPAGPPVFLFELEFIVSRDSLSLGLSGTSKNVFNFLRFPSDAPSTF